MDDWTDSPQHQDSSLVETTVDETTLYSGRILQLQKRKVRLANGREASREVVIHPGAVAIVAEPETNYLILVRQFRNAPHELLWELPAGKLDAGEEPSIAACRELREETGYTAKSIELWHSFYTSPGFANEKIWLYFSRDLVKSQQQLDEDELLHMHFFSRDEVAEMLKTGALTDAKTLIGVYRWLMQGSSKKS
ncbi:NUDIX domain-containing protein [Alicyclobacillus tolerans]|uniref:ADP-ribose pyrophosphatase n=2 Tax=Alicyclobacillus tolerans TaxID=90970 RepID=A0A1M6S9I2_9BACL|nr:MULTISPECIES: NUDIX hydrolase [Alicyclobacillus]MDP9728697.1 ADP-ribose pyrophosphatase [Alicyclobacillus tengchongensis]SHK41341.1 ADP-ribose pyrophosphatase [Alicyclobacillus montanus]